MSDRARASEKRVETLVSTDIYSELFQAPVAVVPKERWPVVLETLGIQRSASRFPIALPSQSLIERYRRTLYLAERNNLSLLFLGYAPIFSGTRVYRGRDCDWAMMHLGDDPVYCFYGQRLYAPRPVIEQMERIVQAGIEFDTIFIAHEIPVGSVKPGEPVPLELIIPPPHPQVRRRLSFLESTVMRWWGFVTKVLAGTAKMAAITAIATATTAVGVAALVAQDPVLFGVQFDNAWQVNGQPVGMWYYLTHWYWPVDE